MMWTTPAGFVVLHENRKPKEARLFTADRTVLVYHDYEKQKIDVRKQVDGIVAHLVHSMDAAHMMRTINRLYAARSVSPIGRNLKEGIRHFAMVHDSYGVHACDIDLLNRILREEFVRIYSEPVLQNFIDQQRKAHPGPAGSAQNRRPRYPAGPLVSLLFCLRRYRRSESTLGFQASAGRPENVAHDNARADRSRLTPKCLSIIWTFVTAQINGHEGILNRDNHCYILVAISNRSVPKP
jgi:hypothetical protein